LECRATFAALSSRASALEDIDATAARGAAASHVVVDARDGREDTDATAARGALASLVVVDACDSDATAEPFWRRRRPSGEFEAPTVALAARDVVDATAARGAAASHAVVDARDGDATAEAFQRRRRTNEEVDAPTVVLPVRDLAAARDTCPLCGAMIADAEGVLADLITERLARQAAGQHDTSNTPSFTSITGAGSCCVLDGSTATELARRLASERSNLRAN
jgi:hypothetical protein